MQGDGSEAKYLTHVQYVPGSYLSYEQLIPNYI
jgi:hypothetical protein